MPISDEDFGALVRLIEDGELDDRMVDLIAAIDERNERRKGEIMLLVKSVWGDSASIVAPGAPQSPAAPPQTAPPVQEVPEGFYLAQDGSIQPLVEPAKPKVQWPPPIQAQTGGNEPVNLGVQPVRDAMGVGADPFGDRNPDIVSTGAQIG